MSSGTQVDLDWAGIGPASPDGGFGAQNPLPGGGGNGAGTRGTAQLTDEEILGITPGRTGREVGDSDLDLDGLATAGARHAVPLQPKAGNDPSSTAALNSASDQTLNSGTEIRMPAWLQALVGDPKHGGEAQALWSEHQAFRAAFASADEARIVSGEARSLRELLPGGAQEVQALRQIAQEVDSLRRVAQEAESLRQNAESVREATASVERIDAAIFSGDARAQSEVVAEIARANPAAFRSMFAEAAKVLAGLESGLGSQAGSAQPGENVSGHYAGPTLRKNSEGWGTRNSTQLQSQNPNSNQNQNRNLDSTHGASSGRRLHESSFVQSERPSGANHESPVTNHTSRELRASHSPVTNHQSQVTNHESPTFDPAAYASFERGTNEVVARDVRGSIGDTLARVLPDGVADGAAKRIGEDIFNEVHRALAADRTLSEQVGEVLRDRRFGNAEQQRVAALLAGRAKQLVPSVARRVIGEWTSSVLGTARTKAARQAAAASRVDIAAPGGSLDSMPLRAMSAREVNYASMSDDEILGM